MVSAIVVYVAISLFEASCRGALRSTHAHRHYRVHYVAPKQQS